MPKTNEKAYSKFKKDIKMKFINSKLSQREQFFEHTKMEMKKMEPNIEEITNVLTLQQACKQGRIQEIFV